MPERFPDDACGARPNDEAGIANSHELLFDSQEGLYQGVMDAHLFAIPERGSADDDIVIKIIDNHTIGLSDKRIPLDGHKLYAFNALMLTRTPMTAAELRTFGFDPQAEGWELTHALNSLNKVMKRASGVALITGLRTSNRTLFSLDPNVVADDTRTEGLAPVVTIVRKQHRVDVTPVTNSVAEALLHTEVSLMPSRKSMQGNGAGIPTAPSPERKKKESEYMKRERIFSEILRQYGQDPQVLTRVAAAKVEPRTMGVGDIVRQYYNYASQFAVLKAEQVKGHFKIIETGYATYESLSDKANPPPEARKTLIDFAAAHRLVHLSNLRFVVSIAMTRLNNRLSFMDIIQAGNIGLIQAIARYDHEKKKFSTYAAPWIRREIGIALADQARLIRIPRQAHECWLKLNKVTRKLTNELGREPTEAELARETDFTVEQVRDYQEIGRLHLASLDQPVGDDDTSLIDFLPDERLDENQSAAQLSGWAEVTRIFEGKELSDQEKLVLALRYGSPLPDGLHIEVGDQQVDYKRRLGGIVTAEGLTPAAIGKVLGASPVSVQRVEESALQKARWILERKD